MPKYQYLKKERDLLKLKEKEMKVQLAKAQIATSGHKPAEVFKVTSDFKYHPFDEDRFRNIVAFAV